MFDNFPLSAIMHSTLVSSARPRISRQSRDSGHDSGTKTHNQDSRVWPVDDRPTACLFDRFCYVVFDSPPETDEIHRLGLRYLRE